MLNLVFGFRYGIGLKITAIFAGHTDGDNSGSDTLEVLNPFGVCL